MTTTYMLWCTTYRLWLASKLAQPMLDSKTGCCLGNADARQQNRFLRSNRRCWTAKSDAVQETPMLDSKIVSCTATADARQQNRFLRSNRRC